MPASSTPSAAAVPPHSTTTPLVGNPETPGGRGTCRSRSEQEDASADSDGDHDRPHPKRSRKKPTPDNALTAAGAALGMMGDLFRDFQAVLDAGINASLESPATALSYRERKYLALYKQLVGIAPWLVDHIAERGVSGPLEITRQLEAGRNSVRGVDLYGLKKAVLVWDNYVPVVNPEAKSTRGYNHPMMGKLLCPSVFDWEDPEVRAGLRNGNRKYRAGAQDWPYLLWEKETVNSDNYNEGLLRNVRLVLAGRHSLLGPRAARVGPPGKIAGKKPKARIHRIRSITVGFIAYTAVLVHFSLSAQETFNDGSTAGSFPYEAFYQSIVRYVEESMTEEERVELLSWWNIQIFGRDDLDLSGDSADESDGLDPHQPPQSMLARMKAQAAARRATQVHGAENGNPATQVTM